MSQQSLQEMPGFGSAAEALLFRQNDPKPLTPNPASWEGMDANPKGAAQLAALRQGPPRQKSVLSWAGWQASTIEREETLGVFRLDDHLSRNF